MNAITIDTINKIATEISSRSYHGSAFGYIREICKPYAEVVDTAVSVDALKQWIVVAFPNEISNECVLYLNQVLEQPTEDQLSVSKMACVEYLMRSLMTIVDTNLEKTITVFPWNVKSLLSQIPSFKTMFALSDDNTLPITITFGPQKYQHDVSFEFVMGLLTYSQPTVGNHDFNIMVFDIPLTISDLQKTSFLEDIGSRYKIQIKDKLYSFDTPDFAHGLYTGAVWDNVDHHTLWSFIKDYSSDPSGTNITF